MTPPLFWFDTSICTFKWLGIYDTILLIIQLQHLKDFFVYDKKKINEKEGGFQTPRYVKR
jgi:hypothetical protein